MNLSNGRIWPYTITFLIIMVFGFCVATIVVTSKLPVENSDTYMSYYQDVDANANKFIQARIDFNRKYNIKYLSDKVNSKGTVFRYKITNLDSHPISDAKIKLIVTRPNTHKYDIELNNPTYQDGIYSFANTILPKEGRWDIIAKINVGEFERFYNIKTDTRKKEVKEY